MDDYLDLFNDPWNEALPGGGDFSWSDILAQFGFYPPALTAVAAAVANPTYSNIRAVEVAYRQGGYYPPAALMSWLWGKYYQHWGYRAPGEIMGFGADYWPILLIGVAAIFLLRK